MAINKIIYGSETLIDLTSDTVTSDKLLKGTTAHDKSGETIDGTCTFDVDSGDASVQVAEILVDKTAYARGSKITGTMPNNGSVNGIITNKDEQYIIPHGYHDGSGKVGLDETEKAKLIPSNIRSGVIILGVEGELSTTEGVKVQAKIATPSAKSQTILPDAGYNYLSQVVIEAIPYSESQNSAGGTTVTIG